jgi:PhzF family phenazine biosynthesis protein
VNESRDIRLYQVDAFAEGPFHGNPAAVCILTEPRSESWMQAVAAEMNLSETAFITRRESEFLLRWFTPAAEVRLCGHATLATAHVLWETEMLPSAEEARFHTASGLLTASRIGQDIELNFPARELEDADAPSGLEDALGVDADYVGISGRDYLLLADSDEVVRSLTPDFTRLRQLPIRGLMVTACSSSAEYDFVSRYFAPSVGVDEDPVTGSAHCCLGPFWGERLGKGLLVAYQASARGGVIRIELDRDRVRLRGRAVTVIRGTLVNVPPDAAVEREK